MNRIGLLFGALVVVLLVAWLSGVFDTDFSTVNVPEWTVEGENVEGLSLRTPSDTVVLSRAGGTWRLTQPIEAKVDSVRVSRLLQDLEDLSFGSVVSTNPERHGRYGVDSLGSSVAVRSGQDERVLVVGNAGADYETVYVRVGNDDRVFSSRGRVTVDASVDSWRDRTIISVPRQAVVRVSVEAEEGAFSVRKESGQWIVDGGDAALAADSASVDRWVRRFAPLKGNRFSTSEMFESAQPLARITFETLGGSTAGLELREAETELLVRGPASDAVLTVSSGMKDSLLPDMGSLRADR